MTPEKRHLSRVASLGCVVGLLGLDAECSGRVEVHHIRGGQGMTDRADDMLTLPVCTAHHTGAFGVHHRRSFYARTRLSELDLLAATLRALEILRERELARARA